MSLGKKVAIVAIALGFFFSLGTFVILKVTVLPTFGELEVEAAEKDRSRITSISYADLRALETFTQEYSSWTETYRFARGENPGFETTDLDPSNWQASEINLMAVFNVKGEMIFAWMADPYDGSLLDVHTELPFDLDSSNPNSVDLELLRNARGLIKTPTGLMQAVALPILDSASQGPEAGFLLVGKFYTDQRITEVARQVTADLAIYFNIGDSAPPEVKRTLRHIEETDEPYRVVVDENYVHLYDEIRDIRGSVVGVFQMTTDRTVSQVGSGAIRLATMVIAIASAGFLLAALAFLHFRIVAPIAQLKGLMQRMRKTGELTAAADTSRHDEIGMLGREFNELTEKLSAAQTELEGARDLAVANSSAKSEFLARMSHEIRTPMNGVLGMTELLRNTSLTQQQERFVSTIYESGSTLLALINDILDFSKIEAGKLRMEAVGVDLRRIVEEAAEAFAEPASAKSIELVTVVAADANTHVMTDPTRLRQVLVNLMGNALKFTEDGEIVIRLETEEVGDRINARFEVRDTGIGIREENQAAIFESFTQEDGSTTRVYGGTGLGLAISRQIVSLLGGKLELESHPGVGSSFFFTLSLDRDSDYVGDHSAPPSLAGKRVLVVDDNATNLEILENHLASWRAEVVTAKSASAAIDALDEAETPFDLAILDWHMPETDGLELARQIRAREESYTLRILMLSSLSRSLEDDDRNALCISTQITKPVRQSDLYDALLTVLGSASAKPATGSPSPADRHLEGRVLLAEDNMVNQAVAVGMLRHVGLEVDVVANGKEAVDKVAAVDYDAVLMDCQMPILDGFGATREIRRQELACLERPTAIIALTANALKGDREKCLEAGMNDYLSKPFTAEQLYSVLSLWIAREPRPDEAANDEVSDRGASRAARS